VADGRVTVRGGGRSRPASVAVRVHYRLTAWWAKVIVVYVLSRAVTTVLLVVLAAVQGPNPWTGAHPGYFDFASIWDGRWYDIVATGGYPKTLPLTADGHVAQNQWAFLPAYPFLVSALMFVTQLPWPVVAVLVSLGFGLGASLLFYRLLVPRIGPSAALYAVVLFCVAPASPLFQLAYAESMFLFLIALALLLLVSRRYGWLMAVLALMGFVRPGTIAFALALGLHVVHRWFTRARDPFPFAERVASVWATGVALAAGLAWPGIAAVVTGDLNAYADTELAWRADYIGYRSLTPFTPWFDATQWWFTLWLRVPVLLGYAALMLVIALFVLWLFLPSMRRLGVDARLWVGSYGLYLLAVFFPQSSTFRLLMPMFPMLGGIAQPRSRIYRVAVVVLAVALQLGWLMLCWGVDGYDWSPP
jgi:Predicted integral membrane protein